MMQAPRIPPAKTICSSPWGASEVDPAPGVCASAADSEPHTSHSAAAARPARQDPRMTLSMLRTGGNAIVLSPHEVNLPTRVPTGHRSQNSTASAAVRAGPLGCRGHPGSAPARTSTADPPPHGSRPRSRPAESRPTAASADPPAAARGIQPTAQLLEQEERPGLQAPGSLETSTYTC